MTKTPLDPYGPHPYCPYDCDDNAEYESDGEMWACPIHERGKTRTLASWLGSQDPPPDYYRYLQSSVWKRRRRHMLARSDYICQGCKKGRRQLDVHHLTYETLGFESVDELAVLCHDCHMALHEELKARGEKIT